MAGTEGAELVGGDAPADEIVEEPDQDLAVDGGETGPSWSAWPSARAVEQCGRRGGKTVGAEVVAAELASCPRGV